jgi:CRISPR-associated protein (TIGR02710 family)
VQLKEFDDFQAVFREVNHIFRRLKGLGFAPAEIQVDFTSGTKAMSSGAVSAGIFHQCQSLKYITGERRHGVVMDDTEKFLTVNPAAVYARHDLKLSRELIFRLRFATATEILTEVNAVLLDPEEQEERRQLRLVAQAYRAWDIFDHKEAAFRFSKIAWDLLGDSSYRPLPAGLEHLQRLVGEDDRARSDALLLDLYNNARRRGQEGKLDDAVARLYRAVELFAQQLLRFGFDIDSGDVDPGKTPAALHDLLEKHRDDTDQKIKVGLHLDYLLLAERGHPVGLAFLNNAPLRGRLGERNQTILAHGLKTVSQSLFNKLLEGVSRLFQVELPDLEEKAAAVQFPWLRQTA